MNSSSFRFRLAKLLVDNKSNYDFIMRKFCRGEKSPFKNPNGKHCQIPFDTRNLNPSESESDDENPKCRMTNEVNIKLHKAKR